MLLPCHDQLPILINLHYMRLVNGLLFAHIINKSVSFDCFAALLCFVVITQALAKAVGL